MSLGKDSSLATRKDNLQNISLAFKRLFEEVSVRMHSEACKKLTSRSILAVKKNNQFFRNRKSSLGGTHHRKNSFFLQTEHASPTGSSFRDNEGCSQSRRPSISRTTHRQAGVQQRCKSQVVNFPKNQLYNQIASYNELMITKMFLLEDTKGKAMYKTYKDKKLQKRLHLTEHHQPQALAVSPCQSRIRHCQKNRRLHAVEHKQQLFNKNKQRCKTTELQPWETDKPEEFFYLAQ